MPKFLLVSLLALLAGCTPVAPKSALLSEELAHKVPEEKQEILRLACLNRAERITGRTSMWKSTPHGAYYVYDAEVSEMKRLCRRMTEAYFPRDQARLVLAARECEITIERKLAGNPPYLTQWKAMRQVCEAFAGAPG